MIFKTASTAQTAPKLDAFFHLLDLTRHTDLLNMAAAAFVSTLYLLFVYFSSLLCTRILLSIASLNANPIGVAYDPHTSRDQVSVQGKSTNTLECLSHGSFESFTPATHFSHNRQT